MTTVFISYRRSDDPFAAQSIYQGLVSRFGKEHVYFDIDSIPLGIDFHTHIQDAVEQRKGLAVEGWQAYLDVANENPEQRVVDLVKSVASARRPQCALCLD